MLPLEPKDLDQPRRQLLYNNCITSYIRFLELFVAWGDDG